MGKELLQGLFYNEQIRLVYCKTHITDKKTYVNYTIICDVNSVTEDLSLLGKIAATMFIVRELLSKKNIAFGYTVKTSDELDRELNENYHKTINKLDNSEILHCKDEYYQKMIDERKDKAIVKRA